MCCRVAVLPVLQLGWHAGTQPCTLIYPSLRMHMHPPDTQLSVHVQPPNTYNLKNVRREVVHSEMLLQ